MKQQRSRAKLFTLGMVGLLALLAASTVVLLNLQNIVDRFTVMGFTPTASIQALSDRSQMTNHGEFLFFASQPVLDGTQTFNEVCRHNKEYKISILGCYADQKIYIYDIQDERLDGIREVTAAHEMLHAAYDRLSSSEKDRLKPLLESVLNKHQNDDLTKRIQYYEENQPGQLYNELHSIIPTEFRDIGKDLEDYYTIYFEDRLAIVSLYEKYQGRLKGLQDHLTRLSKEISDQRSLISQETNEYLVEVESLNRDIDTFNSRARGGYYMSQRYFNADRGALVERSNELNRHQNQISIMIRDYNQKVIEYNEYSALINDIHESIDSTLAPPPSL